jgi:hypothetical protein
MITVLSPSLTCYQQGILFWPKPGFQSSTAVDLPRRQGCAGSGFVGQISQTVEVSVTSVKGAEARPSQ